MFFLLLSAIWISFFYLLLVTCDSRSYFWYVIKICRDKYLPSKINAYHLPFHWNKKKSYFVHNLFILFWGNSLFSLFSQQYISLFKNPISLLYSLVTWDCAISCACIALNMMLSNTNDLGKGTVIGAGSSVSFCFCITVKPKETKLLSHTEHRLEL